MKKTILLLLLITTTVTVSAQHFKGTHSLFLKGGVVIYDNVDGRMVFEEAPSPGFQFNAGYGYQFTDRLRLETSLGYRSLTNDILTSNTFALVPQLYYNVLSAGRFSILLGGGGLLGLQTYESKNELIEFTEDSNLFVYGFNLSPRFEYLIGKRLVLALDYRWETQFNSIRQFNHIINFGFSYAL